MAEAVSKRSIVYEILVDFKQGKKSIKEAEASLKGIDTSGNAIDKTFKRVGGALAAAFATEKIIQFANESVELARKAEGVRKAFNRLNDPNLLNDLRKATKGTVDDFRLMQAAVSASKFKIPLQQLGTYFAFARQRARETGQSVDDLVKNIVEGIGKKSTQVLDNLGISAQQIQDEFKKTGDFAKAAANVIQREFELSGEAIVTSADVFETFRANVENFKLTVGEALLPLLNDFIGGINAMAEAFSNAPAPISDTRSEAEKIIDDFKTGNKTVEEHIQKIAQLSQTYEVITTQFGENDAQAKEVKKAIDFLTASLDSLSKKAKDDATVTITKLQEKLKEVNDQLVNTDVTSSLFTQLKQQAKDLEDEITRLLRLNENLGDGASIQSLGAGRIETSADREAQRESERQKEDALKTEVDLWAIKTNKQAENFSITQQLLQQDKTANELIEKRLQLSSQLGEIGFQLLAMQFQNSKAASALAVSEILFNQGVAISKAISSAKGLTGLDYAIQVATAVGSAVTAFAQINQILSRAQSAQANAEGQLRGFAEGTPYLERDGHPRGTDTIPIRANEGERIIPTDENMKHWDLLEAIRLNRLEDYINFNYVSPALATKAVEEAQRDSMIDYSNKFYRQYIATSEGNLIQRKAVSVLASIDRKIGGAIPAKYDR